MLEGREGGRRRRRGEGGGGEEEPSSQHQLSRLPLSPIFSTIDSTPHHNDLSFLLQTPCLRSSFSLRLFPFRDQYFPFLSSPPLFWFLLPLRSPSVPPPSSLQNSVVACCQSYALCSIYLHLPRLVSFRKKSSLPRLRALFPFFRQFSRVDLLRCDGEMRAERYEREGEVQFK